MFSIICLFLIYVLYLHTTESPLKHLTDSVIGQNNCSDFAPEGEGSHSAVAEKAACCHPIVNLAASCCCLTCYVLMSPHTTVRRQL